MGGRGDEGDGGGEGEGIGGEGGWGEMCRMGVNVEVIGWGVGWVGEMGGIGVSGGVWEVEERGKGMGKMVW